MTDGQIPDTDVGLILRWAVVEQGTAGLADMLGPACVVPAPPTVVLPPEAVVCGPVLVYRREQAGPEQRRSSYAVIRESVQAGRVVLIHADIANGAAFGSGIALQAASIGAAAMLTDGRWRDSGRLKAIAMPVGANGSDPTRPADCPIVASERETLFDATWRPGDWLLRDADGMIRLDPAAARAAATSIAASPSGDLPSLLGRG